MHVIGAAPGNRESAVPGKAVDRMAPRRLVDRQGDFPAAESKPAARDPAGPRKQQRNAAAKRMGAPGFQVGRTRDHAERRDLVLEALASEIGCDLRALTLGFKRYEFHHPKRNGRIASAPLAFGAGANALDVRMPCRPAPGHDLIYGTVASGAACPVRKPKSFDKISAAVAIDSDAVSLTEKMPDRRGPEGRILANNPSLPVQRLILGAVARRSPAIIVPRLGFVHLDRPSLDISAVQFLDSGLGGFLGRHLHETKPS